jgi:4-hydroxy-3-methylbut-2-enyl diphosphate reductase
VPSQRLLGVFLAQPRGDVAEPALPACDRLAPLAPGRLGADDTRDKILALEQRFNDIQSPDIRDICYATQNRQSAVRDLGKLVDVILAVGATNSSNSSRLRETEVGIASYGSELNPEWLKDAVGVAAGASAPEVLVDDVIEALRRTGPVGRRYYPGAKRNLNSGYPLN